MLVKRWRWLICFISLPEATQNEIKIKQDLSILGEKTTEGSTVMKETRNKLKVKYCKIASGGKNSNGLHHLKWWNPLLQRIQFDIKWHKANDQHISQQLTELKNNFDKNFIKSNWTSRYLPPAYLRDYAFQSWDDTGCFAPGPKPRDTGKTKGYVMRKSSSCIFPYSPGK